MAKVNLVEKKAKLNLKEIIKYQLITYCFMSNIQLSDSELDCLTLLGIIGKTSLNSFCERAVRLEIFKRTQSVRNFISKAEGLNLVTKHNKSKKTIKLDDKLNIQTQGSIMLDFKLVYVTKEQ